MRGFPLPAVVSKLGHYPPNNSFDRGESALCFHPFYESRFLHQIGQEASPGLPGGPSPRQDLRHQQSRAALQSAPRLIQPPIAVKAEGHPTLNNVCFLDVATGKRFLTRSTMKSQRKETIDGVEYSIVIRDVTMDSHPAYTGEKRIVDTAGRVEKFTSKFKRIATKK
jgi:large subunit ribosomal protein L31